MKKTVSLLFALFAVVLTASATEKDFMKTVQKYDVPEEVRWLEAPTASQFWTSLLFNDWQLRKFNVDMRKDKGLEKRAEDIYSSLPRFYPQYAEYVDNSRGELCERLARETGIADVPVKCGIYVIKTDIVDAFTSPMEDGFAICLTSGLVDNPKVSPDMLKGYVAREFAHGALKHTQREIYNQGWLNRKANIAAGVAAGLNAILNDIVFDDGTVRTEAITYQINREETYEIYAQAEWIKTLHALRYTRGQEDQADLVAYRFMQSLGNAESYIDCLRLLSACNDPLNDENRTPSRLSERINLLKYVAQNEDNPELINTENRKLKRKRKLVKDALNEKKIYNEAMKRLSAR